MLTDTLYRQPRTFGVQLLQKRGEGGARELSTRRLRLAAGATGTYQLPGEETVLVLQEGRGHVCRRRPELDLSPHGRLRPSAPARSTCRPASR